MTTRTPRRSALAAWRSGLASLMLCWLSAQATPPPAEVFFQDADIAEAVLSPSGRQLAITSAKGANRVGLVLLDLGPEGQMQRIAQFTDGDVTQVHWVNDERLIFSVTDLSDGSGRPNGAPGLYSINTDGKQLRQLVRRMGKPFFTSGERDQRILEWNHFLLRVPVQRPGQANEEILIAEYGLDEIHTLTPMWMNARTGRTRAVNFNQPKGTVGWLTDENAEPRVAITAAKGRRGAWWRGPGSAEWVQLYEADLFKAPFTPNAVDNAGNLYVTRTEGPQGLHVLARYDFAAKAPEAKALVVTPGFDFAGSLLTDGAAALGVRVVVDGETTVWFNDAMKALQQKADTAFPGRINRISCRRCGQADMVALVRSLSDQDPGRLWYYQAQPPQGEKAWQNLGRMRAEVKPEQMATLDLHRISARDGRDLPVWVTRLPNTKGPLPAVVLVHGGPWLRGGSWGWHPMPQFLASRGYVVIEPEFRGSTGYGDAHFKAGFKQWGLAMQDDVADALRWARDQGLASDKACIAGASYGGYSTLMGLARHPELYRCGVAWVAVTDLDLLLRGSWWIRDDTSSLARQYALPEMIGDPDKDAALIAANSPVKLASRIQAPVLLAFGEDDRRVPLAHGKRMRDALREAGNEPVWVTYPGEGHGFAVLKNRLDFAQRLEAFLAQHLAR